jgi:hypothetical protein
MGRVTERKPTPGIRERSMGHCELRAYNAATRKQIVRTCLHPRQATSAGCRYPRSEEKGHARLASYIRSDLSPWMQRGDPAGSWRMSRVFPSPVQSGMSLPSVPVAS